MPMLDKEKHEELLNELLNPDLETSRKTEILQELRVGHTEGTETISTLTENNDKLQADNSDLIVSNSKLFRQAGIVGDKDMEDQEDKKEYSESVTIESLEGAS